VGVGRRGRVQKNKVESGWATLSAAVMSWEFKISRILFGAMGEGEGGGGSDD